ncbi:hypothetical protein JMJ58_04850 [Haloterrigena salifodinae]|uniref:Uncharacterized protein n=1 Tax=Haloterrigena salifodinae TaxID=2675099 RepID=A0A8T8E401_9EURY|nr:hypothetical protein [Haloterrigena salifodinae]QRV16226.1 hypothetical protein JMJ58_04850 [Haloterrigena salifodinae]
MGQRQSPAGGNSGIANDGPSVDEAVRRLEVDAVADIARAAFDHAGELAALQHGHTPAVLGAVRLATRRSRRPTVDREELAAAFDVDPDDVVAAESELSRHLGTPAPESEIASLQRRLIVARELLAAAERGTVAGPDLPGSYLAAAAPFLLARAAGDPVCLDDREAALDEASLRTHVERLEADLECARLGTKLAALVADE